jgi:4-hydroxy-tetrahydrodipicolinate synthase
MGGGEVTMWVSPVATFEGTLEDQAKLMNEMGKIATAVVIITNQIAGMEESDDVWIANAQRLLDLTGDIPVGTYETPVPRVRSLTTKILNWAAGTNRFVFHKDTSLDCNTMLEKLETIKRTKIK